MHRRGLRRAYANLHIKTLARKAERVHERSSGHGALFNQLLSVRKLYSNLMLEPMAVLESPFLPAALQHTEGALLQQLAAMKADIRVRRESAWARWGRAVIQPFFSKNPRRAALGKHTAFVMKEVEW
jgi:hypothetical protein